MRLRVCGQYAWKGACGLFTIAQRWSIATGESLARAWSDVTVPSAEEYLGQSSREGPH